MDHQAQSLDLRGHLADRLASQGALRTREWRAALEAVPREAFLGQYFHHLAGPGDETRWMPVVVDGTVDPGILLKEIYSDESLVTQLDGTIRPADVSVPVFGTPTSSATMPSLVIRMWENLLVDDLSMVAEVGTGTGYSTALACERLGSHRVTSVDVDAVVVESAREALAVCGYQPRLAAADALDGLPPAPAAGYDRVVAACSLRSVPRGWLQATKPGGLVLLTLTGWLHAFALGRVEVTGPGTAEGWFLDDPASFMPARREAAPGIGEIRTGAADEVRSTASISPVTLEEYPGRLLAQLAVPNVQQASGKRDGEAVEYLVDVTTDSYAVINRDTRVVCQGGPVRIWDAIEAAIHAWRTAGSPAIDGFKVTITAEHQFIGFEASPRLWHLP
ncbi:ATP-grasp peptide maturase system methyltransferase [Kribbella sp. NPDC050241]|uniref:ATP-grasp peptide maturase system methyltransferase n=1 Tax=Kribbella sp. NPDC050241 TaxID=3364115 RepID=UPI00378749D3